MLLSGREGGGKGCPDFNNRIANHHSAIFPVDAARHSRDCENISRIFSSALQIYVPALISTFQPKEYGKHNKWE